MPPASLNCLRLTVELNLGLEKLGKSQGISYYLESGNHVKTDGIRQLQLLSFVYDCHNKLSPVHFQEYFVPCSQVHRFNTRLASRGDLFLERKNTFQYGIRSIEFTGARLWNMLPVPLRESSSAAIFRAELKKHLLSSSYASL